MKIWGPYNVGWDSLNSSKLACGISGYLTLGVKKHDFGCISQIFMLPLCVCAVKATYKWTFSKTGGLWNLPSRYFLYKKNCPRHGGHHAGGVATTAYLKTRLISNP